MKKATFILCLLVCTSLLSAKDGDNKWNTELKPNNSFSENKGQFRIAADNPSSKSEVLYAVDYGSSTIYFSKKGITYSFLKRWKEEKGEREEREEREEEAKAQTAAEHMELESHERKMEYKFDVVTMLFENADANTELIAEDLTHDYQSYCVKQNGKLVNYTDIRQYRKLIYKNIYPDIDIEYTFHPQGGLKYAVILHPGADITKLKMKYDSKVKLDFNKDILISTAFGDIKDHAPLTFYGDDKTSIIGSSFVKNGKTVSFSIDDYDDSKTVIIDPWTQTPTLPASNGVWECEKDLAGNVYIIGGDTPMKLLKYNAGGVLQWTYNTPWDTANYWLGTFATDNLGTSYVTAGSIAELQRINNAGGVVYTATSGLFSSNEYWHITFNCDQTKLIIGGTYASALLNLRGCIFDINTATGAITSQKIVGYGSAFSFPPAIQEVRSMCSSYNARYYFITLDSIGCIDQNFTACPTSSPTLFSINDGYAFSYKMENYRPNNGNSGICALAANKNFLYSQNGITVQKRDLNTGAIITTVAIPAGASTTTFGQHQQGNSGIDIDSCGNVYVGSTNAVLKYDANLVLLGTFPTAFKVYDVCVSTGGNVIACGATGDNSVNVRTGYVQSFAMTACSPQTLICCDANICHVPAQCVTGAAFNLSAVTPGGVWSGTGITNTSLGTFNPVVAGTGLFTITYTLACGSSSIQILVSPCAIVNLIVCAGTAGLVNVSGGTPVYTWYSSTTTTPCNPGLGTFCGIFTVAGAPVTTWSSFATGSSATPTTYPIWIVDVVGDSILINSFASLPLCVACPPLTVTPASQINVSCFGASTGSFSATTTGGASPYNYTLMLGATTVATFTGIAGSQSFPGLAAGTYTLNVTDINNCPGSITITITQPATAVSVAITASSPSTCGASNGSATATASGGTTPYTYVWSNGTGTLLTTSGVTGSNTLGTIAAGTYTVTVTDAGTCVATATVTITSTGGPTLAVSPPTNVLCFGGSTGSATVTASGGTSPYTYTWTNAASTVVHTDVSIPGPSTASGLPAGTYTISVTDAGGCTSTTTVTITQPASAVAVAITGSTPATCGSTNGSATALASGGTSAYTYVWTGASGTLQTTVGSTTSDVISTLGAGTYTVTVTDANGCVTSANVTITSSGGATPSLVSQTDVLCFGAFTGSATVSSTGGTSPYDYTWTNAIGTIVHSDVNITTPSTATGLAAGTYTVTVTDAAGCISTMSVTILQPATAVTVTITGTISAPCGSSTGSATALASGGISPWDYVWSNGSGTLQTTLNITTSNTLGSIAAGIYTITVTDANGCIATTTATVTNSGGGTTTLTSQVNVLCFGASTGSAIVNTTGGASPYDYTWTNAVGTIVHTDVNISTPSTATGLAAGVYTVTVTDNSGCVSSVTVTITQPAVALTVASTSITNATCGNNNGLATVAGAGGTVGTGYTYTWAPTGGPGATATGLGANTYTVTVTDGNGCTATNTVVITNTGAPTVTVASQINVNCNGASTGSATVTASGGSGTYTYSWTGSASTTATATALAAGTYTVTVSDGTCTGTATVTITQNPALTGSVATTSTPCALATGSATVTASGGSGALTYLWSNAATSSTITALAGGVYSVTVTDALGCTAVYSGTVATTGGPTANAGPNVTILAGDNTQLTGSGGGTYLWSPASSLSCVTCQNPLASPTVTTIYTLTVTLNGCTDTDTMTVFVEIRCGELFVPQAFSPNKDGANDILYVYGECIESLDYAVFDRWGEKVFSTNDPGVGWDGTYNGNPLDAAVFVWYLVATVDGIGIEKHGNVTLVK